MSAPRRFARVRQWLAGSVVIFCSYAPVTATEIDARVEDDGIGIDADAQSSGTGLESLNLRAVALRGDLAVGRGVGRGTALRCRCPQSQSAA